MRPSLYLLGILLLFSSTLHAASLRKAAISNSKSLDPYKSQLYKVPLSRVDLPPERTAEFINILTKTHTKLKELKNSGAIFLQEKSWSSTTSHHDIKLSNYQNSQFLGEISIGGTSNTFKVIFDTGSANIWIDSDRCNDVGCVNHKQFKGKESPTYKTLGFDLDVEFGTGELMGKINADNVYLAGVPVEQQQLAEITREIGEVFAQSGFDGIVGLGYPSMAAYNMKPIFDNIMKQGKLDKNVFSFFFDGSAGSQSSHLVIGGADPSYYVPPMTYFQVTDKYYWTIQASQILLDGRDVGLCRGGCKVVADTGTSLVTSPTEDMQILLDYINNNGACTNMNSLPTITFVLKNGASDAGSLFGSREERYTLSPTEYMINNADYGAGEGCAPGIMPLDVPEPHGPLWILGDMFLKKYYSVYDRDNDMVGFALAKKGF